MVFFQLNGIRLESLNRNVWLEFIPLWKIDQCDEVSKMEKLWISKNYPKSGRSIDTTNKKQLTVCFPETWFVKGDYLLAIFEIFVPFQGTFHGENWGQEVKEYVPGEAQNTRHLGFFEPPISESANRKGKWDSGLFEGRSLGFCISTRFGSPKLAEKGNLGWWNMIEGSLEV